jgi:5-methylphenazine-1-carboxylate 1-monooxygenase
MPAVNRCIFRDLRQTALSSPGQAGTNDERVRKGSVMKVIIAGGGVGGLVTGLMLHARGIDCEIFEQSDAIRELGVGINTLPHAIKELADLGLLERLDAVAIRTYELIYANRFGQEIWREPRGVDAGYEVPQFSIHRGRLQNVIYQAARARLGEARIHMNCRLGSFTQDDGGVTAYFFDRGGSHRHTARGDILVGADGIHSLVREKLFPNEGPPRWNGLMLWRGAIDWPAFLTGRSMVVAGGLAAKLVIYPIAEGSRPDKRLTNWAVVGRVGDASMPVPQKQDWSRPGRFEDLMPHVQRFRIPFVDGRALIEATGEFWEYPMCDRDPLPRWSHGRVTLLGDAAHPMYPVGSNGASQAILDARFLADRLKDAEHPVHALWLYEQTRLPITAEIVQSNRRGGPEGVIDAVEARAPEGFSNIEDVLSFEQRKAIVRGYASKAGFAREQVNKAA